MTTPAARNEARLSSRMGLLRSQEGIVFALALVAFVLFSVLLPSFLSPGNLLVLVRSVSILGILALGMALVVIARGIDVSMIAIMVVSVSWAFVITRAGYPFEVVNAGVSGDTSAGGVRRLDWALEGNVRVLILALGANDGLRGLPVDQMKKNLEDIIQRARARNIVVILAGMEAPPNYGPDYTSAFRRAYQELAREHELVFLPFLLDKVAGDPALNQGDGIHPNARGAEIIAEGMWKVLRPVLDQMSAAS